MNILCVSIETISFEYDDNDVTVLLRCTYLTDSCNCHLFLQTTMVIASNNEKIKIKIDDIMKTKIMSTTFILILY